MKTSCKNAMLIIVTAVTLCAMSGCSKKSTEVRGEGDARKHLALAPMETFKSCAEISEHIESIFSVWARYGPVVDNMNVPTASRRGTEQLGNRQESGVAEADFTAIGKHQIVVAQGNKLTILRRSDLSTIGHLYQAKGQQISGLYIDGDRMAVLVKASGFEGANDGAKSSVSIFSMVENKKPELLADKQFQDQLTHSRVTNGHLIGVFHKSLDLTDKAVGSKLSGIECTNIAKPQVNPESLQLTKVIALNLHAPEHETSILGAFAAGNRIYMNEENLYLTEESYSDTTGIHKIRFDAASGKLQFSAGGKAPGVLQDDFAMREVTLTGSKIGRAHV